MAGRLIHDWHRFGVLTVDKILVNSSDVGAIKVALQLGAPRFYDTIRAFGIGNLPESNCRVKIAGCCGRSEIGRPARLDRSPWDRR